MKKIISFILAAIMVLSSFSCVFADDGDQVGKLILSVKERFDIDDNTFIFDNYSKDDYNGTVTYYLSWKSKADDQYSRKPYISVNVREDGEVQSYIRSSTHSEKFSLHRFSDEEIKAKAKEYIEKISPDRYHKLSDATHSGEQRINVQFERLENNIPVSGDYISVELDGEDLSLISYNANWTDAEFPSPENIITVDKAKSDYADNIGYELLHNIKTKNSAVEKVYLSYASKDPSAFIDAFTGDAVKHSSIVYKTASSMANDTAVEESALQLSFEEQKMVDDINKMITKDDAEKIVRSIPEFDIRKDAAVTGYNVSKNVYGDYIANINFGINKDDDYYYAHASINVNTREIISFSESEKFDSTAKAFDKEKAEKNALDFINKYYKDKMDTCQSSFVIGERNNYRFTFDRFENGVRVKGNGLNVSINEQTGDISSFSCNWANAKFPEKDNVVAPSYIYKDVLKDDNFRLQYVTTVEFIYDQKDSKQVKKESATLVYAVKQSPIYDAISGNKIDSRGEVIREKFAGYSDLSGHYSEKAAEALARAGIYFEGGKLEPDKDITQIEYLRFIHHVLYGGYYSSDNDIYTSFINNGIITEEEIGRPLTRSDAIRYMINALGYKEVAEISEIYNCTFKDVDPTLKGYVSIAAGFGIINNSSEMFRPDDIITRGEAVTVIHNHLNK